MKNANMNTKMKQLMCVVVVFFFVLSCNSPQQSQNSETIEEEFEISAEEETINCSTEVSKNDLKKLRVLVYLNNQGKVESSCFEQWNIGKGQLKPESGYEKISYTHVYPESKSKKKKQLYNTYGFLAYHDIFKKSIAYDDFHFFIMTDDGFEFITQVITVWTKKGTNYELYSILDEYLTVAIGGSSIEKIMKIDNEKALMIGKSEGGDAEYSWGMLWLGVWEKPSSLKIVYEFSWENEWELGEESSLMTEFEYEIKNSETVLVKAIQYIEVSDEYSSGKSNIEVVKTHELKLSELSKMKEKQEIRF